MMKRLQIQRCYCNTAHRPASRSQREASDQSCEKNQIIHFWKDSTQREPRHDFNSNTFNFSNWSWPFSSIIRTRWKDKYLSQLKHVPIMSTYGIRMSQLVIFHTGWLLSALAACSTSLHKTVLSFNYAQARVIEQNWDKGKAMRR